MTMAIIEVWAMVHDEECFPLFSCGVKTIAKNQTPVPNDPGDWRRQWRADEKDFDAHLVRRNALALVNSQGQIVAAIETGPLEKDWSRTTEAGARLCGAGYIWMNDQHPADRGKGFYHKATPWGRDVLEVWHVRLLGDAPLPKKGENIENHEKEYRRKLWFGREVRWEGHWTSRESFCAAVLAGSVLPGDTVALAVEGWEHPYITKVNKLQQAARYRTTDGDEVVTDVTNAAFVGQTIFNPSWHERRLFPAGEGVRQSDGTIALYLGGMGTKAPITYTGRVTPLPEDVLRRLRDGSCFDPGLSLRHLG